MEEYFDTFLFTSCGIIGFILGGIIVLNLF